MDYKELVGTARKKAKRAYLIYGQDEQLIFEVRNALREAVLDEIGGMNHIRLDGTKATYDDALNALSTYSMFPGGILVEISKCTFMDKEAGTESPLRDLIAGYLENPREDLYFFASYKYDSELEKKNVYLDSLKKKVSGASIIEHIDAVKQKGMPELVDEAFTKRGGTLPKPMVSFIADNFKGSLLQLEKEADKLLAYTSGREVTKADVLKVMTISDERHVMNLLDLIFTERGIGRNIREILSLQNDLIYRGEKPEAVIGIIGSRIRLLFGLRPMIEEGKPMTEIAAKLRTSSSWYAERMSRISGSISYKEYARIFRILLESELTLKSSSVDPASLLEVMVLSICDAKENR